MILDIFAILVGFALLTWSADKFVDGSAAIANNLGISPLVIGLTIMGFGTSAPEMLVSAFASWQGNPELAIGNAIGSNIANIALVLGATALVAPLTIDSSTLRREFPILILITVLAILLLFDQYLGFTDGIILLATLIFVLSLLIWLGKHKKSGDPLADEFQEEIPTDISTSKAFLIAFIGLAVLLISSKILVWGAVNIATSMGVSDLVIGLTIIAIGTSLPELAASISSARKGEHEMAVGNVIGSNLFNLLGVLSVSALIHPTQLSSEVMGRDYPLMTLLTITVLVAFHVGKKGVLGRVGGFLLLSFYTTYMTLLFFL